MNYTEQRAALVELEQHGAVIHWLAEATKHDETDIIKKLETLGDLAEQFAEDAHELAAKFNNETENMEAANE